MKINLKKNNNFTLILALFLIVVSSALYSEMPKGTFYDSFGQPYGSGKLYMGSVFMNGSEGFADYASVYDYLNTTVILTETTARLNTKLTIGGMGYESKFPSTYILDQKSYKSSLWETTSMKNRLRTGVNYRYLTNVTISYAEVNKKGLPRGDYQSAFYISYSLSNLMKGMPTFDGLKILDLYDVSVSFLNFQHIEHTKSAVPFRGNLETADIKAYYLSLYNPSRTETLAFYSLDVDATPIESVVKYGKYSYAVESSHGWSDDGSGADSILVAPGSRLVLRIDLQNYDKLNVLTGTLDATGTCVVQVGITRSDFDGIDIDSAIWPDDVVAVQGFDARGKIREIKSFPIGRRSMAGGLSAKGAISVLGLKLNGEFLMSLLGTAVENENSGNGTKVTTGGAVSMNGFWAPIKFSARFYQIPSEWTTSWKGFSSIQRRDELPVSLTAEINKEVYNQGGPNLGSFDFPDLIDRNHDNILDINQDMVNSETTLPFLLPGFDYNNNGYADTIELNKRPIFDFDTDLGGASARLGIVNRWFELSGNYLQEYRLSTGERSLTYGLEIFSFGKLAKTLTYESTIGITKVQDQIPNSWIDFNTGEFRQDPLTRTNSLVSSAVVRVKFEPFKNTFLSADARGERNYMMSDFQAVNHTALKLFASYMFPIKKISGLVLTPMFTYFVERDETFELLDNVSVVNTLKASFAVTPNVTMTGGAQMTYRDDRVVSGQKDKTFRKVILFEMLYNEKSPRVFRKLTVLTRFTYSKTDYLDDDVYSKKDGGFHLVIGQKL